MKKILLFPYHPDVDLIAEKAAELKGFSIAGVCSFQEDQAVVNKVNGQLGCTGSFTELLNQCDIVLLLDNYREARTEKYYEVIQAAVDANKQVAVMPSIGRELDLGAYQGKYILLQDILEIGPAITKKETEAEKIKYTIESPVIVVFGMGKSCCKFENQILLKSILNQEGYESVWISSNPLGVLFGGYAMPDFLYDGHMGFEEKVLRFNQFVYRLSITQRPDVFLIGVPEGITEFAAHENNHFAEYPLVVGSAVSVDEAVLCTYFLQKIHVEGMEKMLRHCRERFGFPVHTVSVGRTAFENSEEFQQVTYLFLEEEYLKKNYKAAADQPDDYAGIWEAEKRKAAVQKLLARLQENPDAV